MKYLVLRPLYHQGQDYKPNDEIDVEGELAELLKANGAIEDVQPRRKEKPAAAPTP